MKSIFLRHQADLQRPLLSFFLIVFFFYFLSFLPRASAQNVSNKCLTDMHALFLKEQVEFRSVVFGQRKAKDTTIGSVRFDGQGTTWMKTKENEWKSLTGNGTGTDSQMDGAMTPKPRRGILETKQALTSELLPPILQSLRAFQCKLRSVCALVSESQGAAFKAQLTVEVDGCIPYKGTALQCNPSQPAPGETSIDLNLLQVQVGVCDSAAQAIFDREANVLTAVLSYDTSYRQLLQIAGIVADFGEALRGSILDTLPKMVQNVQTLGSIPCFNAQCDQ